MKAPVCRVCMKWGSIAENTGVWIQFKRTQEADKDVIYGHPEGLEFFCSEHSWLGYKYRNLSWDKAEPLIRQAIENNELPPKSLFAEILDEVFKLFRRK